MNPSRIFILRPVATSLLMLALLLSGLLGYRLLPVSSLPEVSYPTIQVVTTYPGASPEVMVSSITAPLERQLGKMAGLVRLQSQNSVGISVITLQFSLNLRLDIAEQEVQAAINAAANLLPDDLPYPPIYSKINPADAPVLTLAIYSLTLPLPQIHDLVDTRIVQKIAQVSGVGQVNLVGGQRPAVRIQVNPTALAAHQLSLTDIYNSVRQNHTRSAKGSFDGAERSATIDANDQLQSIADYQNLILRYENQAPLRLRDVADVLNGVENEELAAWSNLQPAIILQVLRQPGSNVIEVVDHIKQLLPQLRESLPVGVELQELTDRTVTVRASIHDVQWELLMAIALVVLVIYLFLQNLSATVIPGIAVPLSLIGTLGFIYLMGFSLNNLTLMALTIATGFVVDDAIVMIENIARYLEEGDPPLQAALKGSKQIGFTIISLTLSLVAVMIPLLFMGDVVGKLLREFAITLTVAILLSGVISLTLTPMMCAKLLRSHLQNDLSQGLLARVIQGYAHSLRWVLGHQSWVLCVAWSTLLLTGWLFFVIPKGFFPQQDTGMLLGITEAPQTVSFSNMAQRQQALARELLQDPDVAGLSSFIGVDHTNASLNSGRMQINLKPLQQRTARGPEIIQRLQQRAATVQGIRLYLQQVQDFSLETSVHRTQYQYTLQALDADLLLEWVPRLVARLAQNSALTDVGSNLQQAGKQVHLRLDRSLASRYGISAAVLDEALYNAFGQRQIATIFTQTNQYKVVLEVKPEYRWNPSSLQHVYLPGKHGAQVPLSSVVEVEERTGPLVMYRDHQFLAATISFNLANKGSLGEAVQAVEQAVAEIGLPSSISGDFQGAAQVFKAGLANHLWLVLSAIVVMYIILGVLYESFIHPITILSTLPSAGLGAALALLWTQSDLNLIAIIGILLLIGIVKKNAIMMIDFALEAEREQQMPAETAIYQACLLRFRPILMTTLAALLGALPMVLGNGVGSEFRQPMGIALIGGLLVSQVLTLYTTPVIYLWFDRLARSWRGSH